MLFLNDLHPYILHCRGWNFQSGQTAEIVLLVHVIYGTLHFMSNFILDENKIFFVYSLFV